MTRWRGHVHGWAKGDHWLVLADIGAWPRRHGLTPVRVCAHTKAWPQRDIGVCEGPVGNAAARFAAARERVVPWLA